MQRLLVQNSDGRALQRKSPTTPIGRGLMKTPRRGLKASQLLIASNKSIKELKNFLGLDSLNYLSLEGLLNSTGFSLLNPPNYTFPVIAREAWPKQSL